MCAAHLRAYKTHIAKRAGFYVSRLAEGVDAEQLLVAAPNNPHARDLIAVVLEVGDGPEVYDGFQARRAQDPALTIGSVYDVYGQERPR